MARGDVHFFASFDKKAKGGVSFNLGSDSLKIGLVDNSVVPTVSTADPRWGSAGSTDFSAHEVGHATAYTGPIACTTVTWTQASGVNTLKFDNITVAQDGSGFTNAYYAILYDDTVAGKYAIGFIDLGGPVSIVGGALNINLNASGFGTDTAS
jgi:hypothetical protein